jgi:antitoxin component YwqK of YwqJK toxin-antitoxin module
MFLSNRLFRFTFIISLIITGLSSGSLYAQKINKKDSDGKKQGKWIYFGKDRPNQGFPENGKVEEGEYKDDRKEGFWIKYHLDGKTPKLKGEYSFNRPKGHYVKYHENGKVKEMGTFERDMYQDTLKRYHENGQLEYEAFYNGSGQEEGKVTYYYANGQIEFEYTSKNGKPSGQATRYYENGDIKEKLSFNADGSLGNSTKIEMVSPAVVVKDPGASTETAERIIAPKVKDGKFKPDGYNKVYNENDELFQDGDFKNGRLYNGKMYVYDGDGLLLKVKIYRNGVYHSDGQLD